MTLRTSDEIVNTETPGERAVPQKLTLVQSFVCASPGLWFCAAQQVIKVED